MKRFRIAETTEDLIFPPNNIVEVIVAGKTICIAKSENQFYAFSQKCPHASGLMSFGMLDGQGNVVCPLHRYKFNLTNGRNSLEGYYLKMYNVEVSVEGIFVYI